MGAFFTNNQVKNTKSDSDFAKKVIEFLVSYHDQLGYFLVDNREAADKSIVVLASSNGEWASIYDEEHEFQEMLEQSAMSSTLSQAFQSPVISVLVHDSDLLHMEIFSDGASVEQFSNAYTGEEIDFSNSRPKAWENVLINPYTFSDVKSIWEKKELFVEDFLGEFCPLINIDVFNMTMGYNYLTEEHPSKGISLHFASKTKDELEEIGPAKLEVSGYIQELTLNAGEKASAFWLLTNSRKTSTGLQIVAAGACIENAILTPVYAEIVQGEFDGKPGLQVDFEQTVSVDGQTIYCANIDAVIIPEGSERREGMTPKERRMFMEMAGKSTVQVKIGFVALMPGTAVLDIFFSPFDNMEGGYCYSPLSVIVNS